MDVALLDKEVVDDDDGADWGDEDVVASEEGDE